MSDEITEFDYLDPTELHLVGAGANGFSPLLAKARGDLDDVAYEEACKTAHPSDEHALKFVSAADRRKMARSGAAMPNGDFPIPDRGHLQSAIGRLAEYKGDKAQAKAHIIKRARALGLTHMLPKEWHVTKEASSDPEDGGEPRVGFPDDHGEPRVGFPPDRDHGEGDHLGTDGGRGFGDTAPDKSLPTAEALSQTAGAQKAEGDGTGDKAPHGAAEAADAKDEAETQTETEDDTSDPHETPEERHDEDEAAKHKGHDPDSDPGSPAWEKKDAGLADQAAQLIAQAHMLITELGTREKAEDGTAHKAGRRLSTKTEGAIRRCMQALQDLLDNASTSATKETDDMTNDELIKLLDEREAARREAKKAAKKSEAKKEAKKAAKAEAAKGAEAPEASEAAEELRKTIGELTERLTAIESQPMPTPLLNSGAAVLRSPVPESAFKAIEDRVANAATPQEERTARRQLAAAKMVANENAREINPSLGRTQFGPGYTQLLSNRHALGPDSDIQGV